MNVPESVWPLAALETSLPTYSLPRSPEGSQGHSPLLQSPSATRFCQQQPLFPGWEASSCHTPPRPRGSAKTEQNNPGF